MNVGWFLLLADLGGRIHDLDGGGGVDLDGLTLDRPIDNRTGDRPTDKRVRETAAADTNTCRGFVLGDGIVGRVAEGPGGCLRFEGRPEDLCRVHGVKQSQTSNVCLTIRNRTRGGDVSILSSGMATVDEM